MAMTSAGLAAAIETALGATDPQSAAQTLLLATAIVTYIQTNAVVSVATVTDVTTAQLATVLSATPGSPVTGTITGASGTGTGTIS